ncbi:MAG: hypothetical protein HYY55_04475 [Candidatus Niyogibacteria bacterium]|nr:MAG: hypothetical protein HYY55_04475 [Candidatus Niyogibacteria bacterium]
MDLEKLEEVLDQILEAIGNGANEDVVRDLFDVLYEGVVSEYRPVLKVLPHVADKVAADLVPIIQVFVRIFNAVESDKTLQKELAAYKNDRAKKRFAALKIYQKAGFTRHEAMQLVLQDIANFKALRQEVSKIKGPTSSKK